MSAVCGVDEAGRGPVVGPLVIAGVVVEENERLERLKVKDSKKHSPKRRAELAKQIKKITTYEIKLVSPEEIDAKLRSITLNQLEVDAFAEVIKRLNPSRAYVDAADVDAGRFKRNIQARLAPRAIQVISKHGADNLYSVVSAASILAKCKRDEEVRNIEVELGVPIGSGYPSDLRTQRFLHQWVEEHGKLPPHTRRSWKTAKDLFRKEKYR